MKAQEKVQAQRKEGAGDAKDEGEGKEVTGGRQREREELEGEGKVGTGETAEEHVS